MVTIGSLTCICDVFAHVYTHGALSHRKDFYSNLRWCNSHPSAFGDHAWSCFESECCCSVPPTPAAESHTHVCVCAPPPPPPPPHTHTCAYTGALVCTEEMSAAWICFKIIHIKPFMPHIKPNTKMSSEKKGNFIYKVTENKQFNNWLSYFDCPKHKTTRTDIPLDKYLWPKFKHLAFCGHQNTDIWPITWSNFSQ